jgi:hypothetical protein
LNLIRAEPQSLVKYIDNKLQFYHDTLYFIEDRPNAAIRTAEGKRAPLELIDVLNKQ